MDKTKKVVDFQICILLGFSSPPTLSGSQNIGSGVSEFVFGDPCVAQ